ncbi:MAG: diguanylate cyclase, partial [Blastochloris sp.]|nr:diguanylate cyclase [Blastochloris sp.]
GDMVARLGGDEFTILLDNIGQAEDAIEIAERIKAALAQPFMLNDHEIIATASIGIALGSMGYQQAQDLLRDADTAMYHAKEKGKAGYAIFDQNMHTRAMERLLLQTDLQYSIERHELRIHYQPMVELATERIIGFEALLRWQHPTLGLLAPPNLCMWPKKRAASSRLGSGCCAKPASSYAHGKQHSPGRGVHDERQPFEQAI